MSPFTAVLIVALLAGCAARMVGHPPALTSRQLDELRQSTKDKVVRVELVAPDAPSLELRNLEFLPKTISGTSAEGPRSVAVSDASAVVWNDPSGGTRTGMLAGVIIGAVLGGTIASASCKAPDIGLCSLAAPVGAGVFGLVGLGVGALVGRLIGADARFDIEPLPAPVTNP